MNSKKFLVIVDKYFPSCSANTACMEEIIKYIKSQGHSVDVFTCRESIEEPNITYDGDNAIVKFDTYRTKILNLKMFRRKNINTWAEMPRIARKFLSLMNYLLNPFKMKMERFHIETINQRQAFKLLSQTKKDYDVIITCSAPFILHILGKKLKKIYKSAKLYAVCLDPFVYDLTKKLEKNSVNKRIKIANETFEEFDKIFVQRGIIEENIRRGYEPLYHKKAVNIALPNLKDRVEPKQSKNDKINMVYAGYFYSDIRNPKEMLQILSGLDESFKLSLIGSGCESVVEEKLALFDKCEVERCGQIPKSQCDQLVKNADILINLSNTVVNQMPSKVFEYIGYGKPIINFYFSENDTSLYYLKKYPLCLNININNYSSDVAEQIMTFSKTNKDKQLTFKEAVSNLQDEISENVVNQIYYEIQNDF